MAKQSYSKIAKKLAAKEKKYSKLFENARNEREKVSAQMMLERVEGRKQELASENQMRADQMEGKTFGYGGMTKKKSYLNGGMTKKSVYLNGGMTKKKVYLNGGMTKKSVYATGGVTGDPFTKGSNFNNQDILDYLAANPEFAKYLESKGLTPTLENIKALQEAIGTKVDNKGGANTMSALEKYKADYEAALAQGATPKEAEAVATTNQEADKTIDLKTAKSGIDWMQGNFTPSTMDKAMQGIGISGSFMDNIARARQINRTRPMNAPMYMEAPSIETRMNISPQLNEARNAQAIFNRGIDRSAMSGGQGMAAKASAYAGRINAANKMYGEKSNRETALRNRQRQLAAQTANQNRQMYGQYRNNLVNFENARLGAMAQNTANFGQDLSSIGGDYMKNIRSPKMQLEAYKPLFGDIMSRNFTGLPK